MKRYFPILIALYSFGGFCQTTSEDSLLVLLNNSAEEYHDNIYYELHSLYISSDPLKAIYYGRKHLDHSLKFQHEEQLATSYRLLGVGHLYMNAFDSAEFYLLKAYDLVDSLNFNIEHLKICGFLGSLFIQKDNYQKSVQYYLKFLELSKRNNIPEYVAIGYNNLGLVYYRIEDYKTALEFYTMCLDTKNENNLTKGVLLNYLNIGLCYIGLNNYLEAIIYFKKIIANCQNCENNYLIDSYYGIGKALCRMKKLDESLEYLKKSSEMAMQNSNYLCIANSNSLIAEILIQKEEYENALLYLEEIERINYNFPSRINCKIMLLYSVIYEKRKEYEKALAYKNKYIFLKDSVFSDGNVSDIKNLLNDYQKAENNEIIHFKDIQIKQNRLFVYMFILLFVLLGVILLFAIKNINIRKKLNEKLSDLVEFLNSIISTKPRDVFNPANKMPFFSNNFRYLLLYS